MKCSHYLSPGVKKPMNDSYILETNMCYRDIFYIGNIAMDDEEFMDMAQNWKNRDSSKKPVLVRFYSKSTLVDLPFVIVAASYYSFNGGHRTVRKGLSNYQLILTKDGRAEVIYEDRTYILTKNTAILIDCRKPHTYMVADNDFWEYKHIHFSADENHPLLIKSLGYTPHIGMAESYFDELISYSHNEDSTAPYIYSNSINNILTSLVVNKIRVDNLKDNNNVIEEIAQHMCLHFADDITMSDVAAKYYLSVSHFIRLFKNRYGISPYHYLMNYRLNRAKEFLIMGYPVEECAHKCGFSSLNNFYKTFKNEMNTTPKIYAKDHNTALKQNK